MEAFRTSGQSVLLENKAHQLQSAEDRRLIDRQYGVGSERYALEAARWVDDDGLE